jgi:hypothetical protein
MFARKLLCLAPVVALLTTGSTVWAYTCYFDQNTPPVGFKPIGTPCVDIPSGITMFTNSVENLSGFPITYRIRVKHSNNAALPSSLNLTAFGFINTTQICAIFPKRTVFAGGLGTAQNCYDASGNSLSPNAINVYHYN